MLLQKQPIPRPDGPLQFTSNHYRSLYTCFSLFVVLYLPEPGYEQALIGEELMEWLNTHFIEPSTEEGDALSALARPWEDETFWPYLTRYVLPSGLIDVDDAQCLQCHFTWTFQGLPILFRSSSAAPFPTTTAPDKHPHSSY